MAKANRKSQQREKGTVSGEAPAPAAIEKVRNQVTNVIMGSSVEMARRSVQSVKEGGNITALKYLWEVAGLFPVVAAQADHEEPDRLAKILLERLGAPEEIGPESETNLKGDVESE